MAINVKEESRIEGQTTHVDRNRRSKGRVWNRSPRFQEWLDRRWPPGLRQLSRSAKSGAGEKIKNFLSQGSLISHCCIK